MGTSERASGDGEGEEGEEGIHVRVCAWICVDE